MWMVLQPKGIPAQDSPKGYGAIIVIEEAEHGTITLLPRNTKTEIMTGCLKVSKGLILTGLNNPRIDDVIDYGMDEYFGFTENEMAGILRYWQLGQCQK